MYTLHLLFVGKASFMYTQRERVFFLLTLVAEENKREKSIKIYNNEKKKKKSKRRPLPIDEFRIVAQIVPSSPHHFPPLVFFFSL
jgi:hypothetical protein